MAKKQPSKKAVTATLSIADLTKILFTKNDAKEMELRLGYRMAGMEHGLEHLGRRVERIENTMATKAVTQEHFARIENRLEHLDKAVTQVVLREHAPMLENHEKRLTKLETTISAN